MIQCYKDQTDHDRHAQHDCNLTEIKNSDRLYEKLQRDYAILYSNNRFIGWSIKYGYYNK